MVSSPPPWWVRGRQAPGVDVLGAELTDVSSESESLQGYVRLPLPGQELNLRTGLVVAGPTLGGRGGLSAGEPPSLPNRFFIGESHRGPGGSTSSEATPRPLPALPEVRDGQVNITLEDPESPMVPATASREDV